MSFQSRLPLFGGLAIATGTGTVVSWRLLSSPVYTGPDNWVYAAVGREVAHGHRLDHAFPVTVMKPLAILLGALTTPFPVAHAYQVGVGLCVAALVGFIFFVAFRRAGSVGAVVAVTAFATTPIFWREFFTAPIDFVTSLLIVAAFAARDRARLVVLIFAGLLRPEAWLVAGLVAFDQARGSRSRRSAVALTAMAVAPVTWLVFDAAIAGPNLSTGGGAEGATSVARDIVDSASHVIKSIIIGGGPIVVGLGALGLGEMLARQRPWSG